MTESKARVSVGAKPSWSRRAFVTGAVGAAALAAYRLPTLLGQLEEWRSPWRPGPFGAMRPDPNGLLDLPEGFSYRVVDRAGTRMSDGHVVPARPDGMACFTLPDGQWALMRNHENPTGRPAMGPTPSGPPPSLAFDPRGAGGVSRVVLSAQTQERTGSNLVLAGTALNCAGGTSPWGWLSCEETVEAGHGLVFLCDPAAAVVAPPRPVHGYGRFRHEAAVVDPSSAIAYLTEDRGDGCLYRFVPHDPAQPFDGRLEALRVRNRPGMLTGLELERGAPVEIDWVPVRDATPDEDNVRYTAARDGAAQFSRGEGLAFSSQGGLIISATEGGRAGLGQVLELTPEGEGGELRVLLDSTRIADFEMPDNITFGPGGRVFFCEDGSGRDYVRGLDPETSEVFDFARNANSSGELAGVCFSPDGTVMFLSLQEEGVTLSIHGAFG